MKPVVRKVMMSGEVLYFLIPKVNIPDLVTDYVNAIETTRTNEICKCEWVVHPDDEGLDPDVCQDCKHHQDLYYSDKEGEDPRCHAFQCDCTSYAKAPRRMRRGEQHAECPVHTKEGFILGFFEWVFKDEPTNSNNVCSNCNHQSNAHQKFDKINEVEQLYICTGDNGNGCTCANLIVR